MKSLEEICIGSKLVCDVCGKSVPMNPVRAGQYVRYGWPKCCGETMRLITKSEQAAQAGEGERDEKS